MALSAQAIDARLRAASDAVDSLRPETRLHTKIDLGPDGVARRLREASDLLELCRALALAAPRSAPSDGSP